MKRKTCRACKKRRAFSQFYKRSEAKGGQRATCKDCDRESRKKRYRENTEAEIKYSTAYNDANREQHNKLARESYNRNKKKRQEGAHRWVAKMREKHPGYPTAKYAMRLASFSNRVPSWVAPPDFYSIYDAAKKAGSDFVVDHIVPLRGRLVSGLHVPSNLQVIRRGENASKANTFDSDTHEHNLPDEIK